MLTNYFDKVFRAVPSFWVRSGKAYYEWTNQHTDGQRGSEKQLRRLKMRRILPGKKEDRFLRTMF